MQLSARLVRTDGARFHDTGRKAWLDPDKSLP